MRLPLLASLVVASLVPLSLACGGGTPSAKSSDDVAAKDPASTDSKAASDDAGASSSSSSSSGSTDSDKATAPKAAADAGSSSGDLAAPADDPWLAHHQMPPGDVLKTMRSQQGKVQACFKAGKKRDPSVSGEVKLRFIITNDGAVRDWRDEGSSMTDEEVTKCVGELLKSFKFPKQKSPGDAYGIYSINFNP